MPVLKKLYQDDGKSVNSDGQEYPDHDSNMPYSEVERLVLDSKGLLVGTAFDDTKPLERPFGRLLGILQSPDGKIDVVKGIHQRLMNPHITISIKGDQFNAEYEFHLELSAEQINRTYSNGEQTRKFLWKPVKLSVFVASAAKGGKEYVSHPVGAVARTTGRARSWSITEGQIETHVEGVNNHLAYEAEIKRKEAEEEERKKKAQEEETRRLLAKTEDNYPTLGGGTPKKVSGPAIVSGPKPVVQQVPKGKKKMVPFKF